MFLQRLHDDLERAALVVAAEVFNIFQNKRGGLVIFNDVRQREEKVALFLDLKAVFPAEAQFFGDARDAERLAGKSGAEDVMLGNVGNRDGMDVAVRLLNDSPGRARRGAPPEVPARGILRWASTGKTIGWRGFFYQVVRAKVSFSSPWREFVRKNYQRQPVLIRR
jgi:hypothetical protein